MTSRQRLIGFWLVTGICAVGVLVYAFRQAGERRSQEPDAVVPANTVAEAVSLAQSAHVLFSNGELRAGNGQLAVAALSEPDGPRKLTPLACDRVAFAGGTGVCLAADRGVLTTYSAQVFDATFSGALHTIPLTGIPSRVRVAPNGAIAGVTVFIAGHSYAGSDFSTKTTLIDTRAGTTIADIEEFDVVRNGKPFKAADFNFWGLTFPVDPNEFFATLSSGGVFYLVKGDIAGRRTTVIGTGVECPALSPDGTRVAYKKRVAENGSLRWQLAVRKVATGEEHVLDAETRSIDDQVEWLDDQQILYGASDPELGSSASSVWVIDVNGGRPRRWLSNASSPSIVTAAIR